MNEHSRRDFLKATVATAIGATVAAQMQNVHAAGSDVIKIGLVGCGGRGTGAATQALRADPNVKLIAMGDAFADRLDYSLNKELKRDPELLLIPVVILTTSRAEEDIMRSYELHANAYVSKPVDFEQFIAAIRQIDEFFLTLVRLPG